MSSLAPQRVERVVYVLGAGFSAPLGLPLVRDFYSKSRDMYEADPEKYSYFEEVFATRRNLAAALSYMRADLLDIEELLSLAEMQALSNRGKIRDVLARYIKDVIGNYTPAAPANTNQQRGGWYAYLAEGPPQSRWENYLHFVAGLFNATLQWKDPGIETQVHRPAETGHAYDVISMNYDRVLEIAAARLEESQVGDLHFAFLPERGITVCPPTKVIPWLAKLHGSVDGDIVPPTWSKSIHSHELGQLWEAARGLLSSAHHLRFLGYSLPENDSYIRYFLKTAFAKAESLKTIDIICKDSDGSVRARYRNAISFKHARLVDARTEEYLDGIRRENIAPVERLPDSRPATVEFRGLVA